MSITDGLQKYKVSLEDAFKALQYTDNRPMTSTSKTDEFYIRQNMQGHYFILKWINGKQTNFGTYTTLNDAVKVRNWFVENGWIKDDVDQACQECNVTRRTPRNRRKK
jgi:hypothetical protein